MRLGKLKFSFLMMGITSERISRRFSKCVLCHAPRLGVTVVVLSVVNIVADEFAAFLYTPLKAVNNVRHSKITVHGNEPPNIRRQEIRASQLRPVTHRMQSKTRWQMMSSITRSVHRCLPDCCVSGEENFLSVFA